MGRQIFRKTALERVSTPEQLDQLLPVTSPRGWLALAALGILLLAAVAWGLFGTVTTTVEGQGVLIREDGVKRIVSPRPGVVRAVLVHVGDVVHRRQNLVEFDPRYAEPAAPPRQVGPTDRRGEPGGSPGAREEAVARPRPTVPSDDPYLSSTHYGRVLEVLVAEGSVLQKGSVVVTLEPLLTEHLEGLLYVPVGDGHKVQPGMRVELSPSTVKKNEFGYLIGTVTKVDRFPSSHEAMMLTLENEELVRSLTGDSPCLRVSVELTPEETVSGYQWSSSQGPPLELHSGTPCRARITVREQRPIRLLIPTIRDLLGF
jgi:multidrug efflux pump subunit AcrA (membrane-fusion protein)